MVVAVGAAGVAVMGPVMRDPAVVRDYLAALAERRGPPAGGSPDTPFRLVVL